VDFKCPQCSATTAFSAADGGLTCTHCGYYEPPSKPVEGKRAAEYEFTLENLERAAHGWGEARKEIECQSCGAIVTLPVEALTSTCAFCGSNRVIQRQASQDLLRPRHLVPFKVDPGACQPLTHQWLQSSWMAPSGLKQLSRLAEFTGIYLPYWTFDAVTNATWRAEVGHTRTRRHHDGREWREHTEIEWRWESGHVRQEIDDLQLEGTGRISHVLLERLKGFDLSQLAPYEPKYLAGLHAQAYDIPLEKAWETARQKMRDQTRQACIAQASTPRVRNFSMDLDFSEELWRYILLPVYVASYRYQEKTYQVMVNGQSGAVSGQCPVDWNKVWLVVAALVAPGLLLCLIGMLTALLGGIGVAIGGFGFFVLLIGIVISILIFRKAMSMDDI
jgi:DNA-directed RNA polymerase subunit RPC12/RpoP